MHFIQFYQSVNYTHQFVWTWLTVKNIDILFYFNILFLLTESSSLDDENYRRHSGWHQRLSRNEIQERLRVERRDPAVGQSITAPITAFRSTHEPFFDLLKKRVNGRFASIDQNTILIKKNSLLIGWVNEYKVISPVYDASNSWVLFNLERNQILDTSFTELKDLGVFEKYEGVVRDRSLSPRRRIN